MFIFSDNVVLTSWAPPLVTLMFDPKSLTKLVMGARKNILLGIGLLLRCYILLGAAGARCALF